MLQHLALQGTQIQTKNAFGSSDIHMTDREVGNKLGVCNLSVAAHSWKVDNVLDFLGLDCIMIFLFGVFTLPVVNCVDVCPIMRLAAHSMNPKEGQSSRQVSDGI